MTIYDDRYGRLTGDTYANRERADTPSAPVSRCRHHGKWFERCPYFELRGKPPAELRGNPHARSTRKGNKGARA